VTVNLGISRFTGWSMTQVLLLRVCAAGSARRSVAGELGGNDPYAQGQRRLVRLRAGDLRHLAIGPPACSSSTVNVSESGSTSEYDGTPAS
jgi:hypothetical protein